MMKTKLVGPVVRDVEGVSIVVWGNLIVAEFSGENAHIIAAALASRLAVKVGVTLLEACEIERAECAGIADVYPESVTVRSIARDIRARSGIG